MTDLERARALLAEDPDEMDEAWLAKIIADAEWRGMVAEREKVALWMIERSIPTGHGDTVEDLLAELCAGVADEMRERAAQHIEEMPIAYALGVARAIRALPLRPQEPA